MKDQGSTWLWTWTHVDPFPQVIRAAGMHPPTPRPFTTLGSPSQTGRQTVSTISTPSPPSASALWMPRNSLVSSAGATKGPAACLSLVDAMRLGIPDKVLRISGVLPRGK